MANPGRQIVFLLLAPSCWVTARKSLTSLSLGPQITTYTSFIICVSIWIKNMRDGLYNSSSLPVIFNEWNYQKWANISSKVCSDIPVKNIGNSRKFSSVRNWSILSKENCMHYACIMYVCIMYQKWRFHRSTSNWLHSDKISISYLTKLCYLHFKLYKSKTSRKQEINPFYPISIELSSSLSFKMKMEN